MVAPVSVLRRADRTIACPLDKDHKPVLRHSGCHNCFHTRLANDPLIFFCSLITQQGLLSDIYNNSLGFQSSFET